MADIDRIVALGASNLTRGFREMVSAARSEWGPEVEILAATGHGRSYGASSRVLFRTLPGILQSGLWRVLECLPPAPTRALVTDAGNDILYGYSTSRILSWLEETLNRLQRATHDIIIAGLPIATVKRLSPTTYLMFRSLLFPSSRLSFSEVMDSVEQLHVGLEQLAAARGLKFRRLNPGWYGVDPIHIRRSLLRSAWLELLDCCSGAKADEDSFAEALRLYLMAPERRRLFGIKQFTPQKGVWLPQGGRVWLF